MSIMAILAAVQLGTPFSDGAVLQRGMKVPVWGTADAGERVTVTFAGQEKSATADASGRWRVDLEPMEASSEGRTLAANGASAKDVLVGEVWFASGQSNMDCPLWATGHSRYRDGKGAMMTAMTRLPLVRYCSAQHVSSVKPRDYSAKWHRFVPADLSKNRISAVAFYYARELHLALGVPVGIVVAAWGGTNIDAWTPRSGYDGCDESIAAVARLPVLDKAAFKVAHTNGVYAGKRIYGSGHQQPTVLFNGMVAAWCPMAMKGFIWYQGCHNNGENQLYCAKMHALYNGWAREFENPSLKLYFAQLAPYGSGWLAIAQQQNKFAAEEPNAAIAVTADVGNPSDIHPNDKETVAQRLALHALRRDYGIAECDDDSPTFRAVSFSNDVATVSFDHASRFYVYAPDRSRSPAFELCGTNGVWQAADVVNFRRKPAGANWADVHSIDDAVIRLRSAAVQEPVRVRYMGQPGAVGTVYNELSLPLGYFESH